MAAAASRPGGDSERLRFEGRWVFDSGSASGGVYLGDETEDALARDVRNALDALLMERPRVTWPGSDARVGRVLSGGPSRSPSVVWHAQAIGVLLELGYMPTAACVRVHLDALAGRLLPENARSPEHAKGHDPWLLRTRHVGWALACLSEFDDQTIPDEGLPPEAQQALALYRETTRRAFRYLIDDDGPGAWISVRQSERYWSEYWDGRRQNLLNTIYAAIAVCRASRHGFAVPHGTSWDDRFPVEQTIHRFVDAINVVETSEGPRTHLAGTWDEPWAQGALPCGIVGLLGLLLSEYAHLLLGVARPDSRLEARARRAYVLARRTAHDLASRADEWVSTVDAFRHAGAEGEWWFIPSYSSCVRAVLSCGALPPHHETVVSAFETIARFSRGGDGDEGGFETWLDPMREATANRAATDETADQWHVRCSLDGVDPTDCVPTANSVHAAGMAWAALRRAAHSMDPRRLHQPGSDDSLPASPFTHIRARRSGRRWDLTLHAGNEYAETIDVERGRSVLLKACAEIGRPATQDEIGDYVDAMVPLNVTRVTRSGEGVRGAIRELNEALGVALIEPMTIPEKPGTHYLLRASLEWPDQKNF